VVALALGRFDNTIYSESNRGGTEVLEVKTQRAIVCLGHVEL